MQLSDIWNDSFPPLNLWNCPDTHRFEQLVLGRTFKTVETQLNEGRSMYVMYSKKNCPACDAAANLFKNNGIVVQIVKIDEDPFAKEFVIQQGFRTVPQIYKDNQHIGDFNALKQLAEEGKL